jgi:hypothetical protein
MNSDWEQGLGADGIGKEEKRNSRRGSETQRKREPGMNTDTSDF